MKSVFFKTIALIALLAGGFSCANNMDGPQEDQIKWFRWEWDESKQTEGFRPINAGTESAEFAIDSIITSVAVPNVIYTILKEYPPRPGYGGPNAFSPHEWSIRMIMPEGVDVTKLAPTVTLAPGATIIEMGYSYDGKNNYFSKQVNYTGTVKLPEYSYKYSAFFEVITPKGESVTYGFNAIAIGDLVPCTNCE